MTGAATHSADTTQKVALSNGTAAAYIVMPRCSSVSGTNASGIDEITLVASHEYVEAATDPYPDMHPSYQDVDPAHEIWAIVTGGEVGDMCVGAYAGSWRPTGFPYMVQRTWSNAAAAAGHDPCVPGLPGEVYFNAAPAEDDDVALSGGQNGGTVTTNGVKIPKGQSKTIDVSLYSDARTRGPWKVQAVDMSSQRSGGTAYLTFAFDKSQGINGDHLKVTITSQGVDPRLGAAPFMIVSTLGQESNVGFGVVGN